MTGNLWATNNNGNVPNADINEALTQPFYLAKDYHYTAFTPVWVLVALRYN